MHQLVDDGLQVERCGPANPLLNGHFVGATGQLTSAADLGVADGVRGVLRHAAMVSQGSLGT